MTDTIKALTRKIHELSTKIFRLMKAANVARRRRAASIPVKLWFEEEDEPDCGQVQIVGVVMSQKNNLICYLSAQSC